MGNYYNSGRLVDVHQSPTVPQLVIEHILIRGTTWRVGDLLTYRVSPFERLLSNDRLGGRLAYNHLVLFTAAVCYV